MTVTAGLGTSVAAQDAVSAQQQKIQARDDQKENSTREARNSFTIVSQGVGSIRLAQPIVFDCQFLEEPRVTSGSALVVPPDERLYHFPHSTVGVYKWVKIPQHPDTDHEANGVYPLAGLGTTGKIINADEDAVPMYYTGAYLFFRISCDPLAATSDLDVEEHPATPIMHQHITFTGTAMKILASSISTSADDPDVPPRTTAVSGTAPTSTG